MPTGTATDKGLTIGEAAEKLGVPKKTLRHILARPDRRVRLLHEYRDTKKGLATVEIVPQDLLNELSSSIIVTVPVDSAEANDGAMVRMSEPIELEAPVIEDDNSSPDATGTDAPGGFALEVADIAVDELSVEILPEPISDVDFIESEPKSVAAVDVSVPIYQSAPQSGAADTMLVVATYERLLAEKEARIMDMRAALENEREQNRRLSDALSREQEQRQLPPPAPPQQMPPKRGWLARLLGYDEKVSLP